MIEPFKYLGECMLGVKLHNTGYALVMTGGADPEYRAKWNARQRGYYRRRREHVEA